MQGNGIRLQVPLSDAVLTHRPAVACTLPADGLLACLRGAGPSGTTNEHLRLLLDDPGDGTLLHRAAERLANADVPEPVLAASRVGRAVALQKPNGCVRALVVGDVYRRLVARTLAQHFAAAFQEACLPHQFGLSTRAGTEGLYKLLHTATALDPRATMLSVDVGAFDHVSHQAMLEGLRMRSALEPLLPLAKQFYGSRSLYTWLDADGCEHPPSALWQCTPPCKRPCGATRAYSSMPGKRASGTPLVGNLLTSLTSKCPAGTQSGLAPGPCPPASKVS